MMDNTANIPNPDPSTLTTLQLAEAIDHIQALMESNQKILQTQVDSQFNAIQVQISTLKSEQATQLANSDLRYQQRYDASTQALDAAFKAATEQTYAQLVAQKEAVQVALVTVEKASTKTEAVLDRLMPRSEAESRFKDVEQQIERRFGDLDRNIGTTRLAADLADQKSSDAVEKRFITIGEALHQIGSLSDRLAHAEEGIKGLGLSLNAKIDANTEKVAIAARAADKAIAKSDDSNEKRFEVSTGLAQRLDEQQKTMIGRAEFTATIGALAGKVDDLKEANAVRTGKTGGIQASWGVLLGAIAAMGGLLTIVIIVSNILTNKSP
jgi:hypothetical protein